MIILGLLAATVVPSMASAQSAGEVRHDRHMLREEQRQLNNARRGGDPREIREQRRDVADARRELREDWRDYRQSHRDVYRRGAYAGPRGYAYRPVAPGYRFAPGYYQSRYWINDPWTYRLRRVAGGQRWIRYGNDVVLVNTRNGRVIEAHRDFFW